MTGPVLKTAKSWVDWRQQGQGKTQKRKRGGRKLKKHACMRGAARRAVLRRAVQQDGCGSAIYVGLCCFLNTCTRRRLGNALRASPPPGPAPHAIPSAREMRCPDVYSVSGTNTFVPPQPSPQRETPRHGAGRRGPERRSAGRRGAGRRAAPRRAAPRMHACFSVFSPPLSFLGFSLSLLAPIYPRFDSFQNWPCHCFESPLNRQKLRAKKSRFAKKRHL